jgi:pentatricopeptide repeat protein
VKKFTDWLKQIKRVNENPSDLGTDIETERLIEKIAQSSNETKDVITETMAEVLVKQGKLEKAIQLYQKLSFLDPSKTTYFAAKINELKGSK